jgi:hypothetical protein
MLILGYCIKFFAHIMALETGKKTSDSGVIVEVFSYDCSFQFGRTGRLLEDK